MKTALALFAFGLLSCGTAATGTNDAGRACTLEFVYAPITVLDAAGKPVEGATVSATNEGTNITTSSKTNAQGISTAIGENLGAGTLKISAQAGGKVSETKNLTWTCGDCHCNPSPSSLTLTLSP